MEQCSFSDGSDRIAEGPDVITANHLAQLVGVGHMTVRRAAKRVVVGYAAQKGYVVFKKETALRIWREICFREHTGKHVTVL